VLKHVLIFCSEQILHTVCKCSNCVLAGKRTDSTREKETSMSLRVCSKKREGKGRKEILMWLGPSFGQLIYWVSATRCIRPWAAASKARQRLR